MLGTEVARLDLGLQKLGGLRGIKRNREKAARGAVVGVFALRTRSSNLAFNSMNRCIPSVSDDRLALFWAIMV